MELFFKNLTLMHLKIILIGIFFFVSTNKVFCQLDIGKKLPQFELLNDEGQTIQSNILISDEKYLLVDFWASWCAPCRKANKKLPKLTQKHKRLKVVGISIDKDKKKWQEAIQKDKLLHLNLIEPLGFEGPVGLLFGLVSLPSSFLFNPSGMLIAVNPTFKEINTLIKLNK